MTGPGNIPTNVISGFFDFWGFISAGFLGMKCPHLYSDLRILVLYTRIMDTTFKHEPLGLSQQFGDHVATICPHGLLQHCRGHEMSAC